MKSQAHIFYFIISYFSTVLKTEGETICPALPIIRLWNPVRRNDIYIVYRYILLPKVQAVVLSGPCNYNYRNDF